MLIACNLPAMVFGSSDGRKIVGAARRRRGHLERRRSPGGSGRPADRTKDTRKDNCYSFCRRRR
jgi:hypothetical protein